jgi:hypothetical protein
MFLEVVHGYPMISVDWIRIVQKVYLRRGLSRTQSQAKKEQRANKKNEKTKSVTADTPESSQRVKRNGNAQRVRTCRRAMICRKTRARYYNTVQRKNKGEISCLSRNQDPEKEEDL